MGPSLQIVPRRSRLLVLALSGAHLAAACLAAAAVPNWGLRAAIAVAAAASLHHALRRAALRTAPGAIAGVELYLDGTARITRRDGRTLEARLSHSTFVAPWLVILVLAMRRPRPPQALVLPLDSLSGDDFRHLRVWLRWGRFAPPSGAVPAPDCGRNLPLN